MLAEKRLRGRRVLHGKRPVWRVDAEGVERISADAKSGRNSVDRVRTQASAVTGRKVLAELRAIRSENAEMRSELAELRAVVDARDVMLSQIGRASCRERV